jgi:hypothetical protein
MVDKNNEGFCVREILDDYEKEHGISMITEEIDLEIISMLIEFEEQKKIKNNINGYNKGYE